MSWLGNWKKRMKITLDSSNVDSDLTDFPVCITVASGAGQDNDAEVSDFFSEMAQTIEQNGNDEYTKLLIQSDYPNSTTSFVDSSASSHSLTRAYGAIHAAAYYKFGRSGLYFDGSGDGIYTPHHNDFDFGTGDFTVDFWMYPRGTQVSHQHLFCKGYYNASHMENYTFEINKNLNSISFDTWAGQTSYSGIGGSYTFSADTWYHVAFTRKDGFARIFVNGTVTHSGALERALGGNSARVDIGTNVASTSFTFYGALDEFRVSKGIARWTEDFAVPTEPYGNYYGLSDDFNRTSLDKLDGPGGVKISANGVWQISDYAGTNTIFNNKLKQTVPITSSTWTSGGARVDVVAVLSGDFSVQIDGDSSGITSDATDSIQQVLGLSGDYTYTVGIYKYGADFINFWTNDGNAWGSAGYNDNWTVKLERIGTTIKAYYKTTGSWVVGATSNSVGAGDYKVYLGTYPGGSGSTNSHTAYFDNFKINFGTPKYISRIAVNQNRKKIAITQADGLTQQYVEVARWLPDEEKAVLWTKVPTLSSSQDTELYLYYDSDKNENTTYVGDAESIAANNVWDSNYVAVYHFESNPQYSALLDSSGSSNRGTKSGDVSEASGKLGNGWNFDGNDDYVDCGSGPLLDDITNMTVEASIKADSWGESNFGRIAAKYSNASSGWWHFFLGGTNGRLAFMEGWSTTNREVYATNGSFALNNFYNVSVRRNSSQTSREAVVFTVNSTVISGVSGYDGAGSRNTDASTNLVIGARPAASYDREFDGIIDELRVSNIQRSDTWLKASHYVLEDNMVTIGAPMSAPTYYYEGYVTEYNSPVSRMVRLYDRASGELMYETTSSGSNGYYYAGTTVSGQHYIVVLDDDSGEEFNALIGDRLEPLGVE
jgi:hypothetical protein